MTTFERAKKIIKEIKDTQKEVLIVGASKTKDEKQIIEAQNGGIQVFAENRVQEFEKKAPLVNVRWHFIGSLQSNKVKSVVGRVEIIHSVDSLKLAFLIDKRAKELAIVQDIMVEVNAGEELTKGGIKSSELESFLKGISPYENIAVVGIMPVLPKDAKEQLYQKMHKLFLDLKEKYPSLRFLSMGMSGDYMLAIKCGSNLVRIGSAIFGEREYLN